MKPCKQLRLEQLERRCLLTVTPGLLGSYYDEIDLTDLADTRVDPVVNFPQDWGNAPPGTAVVADDNYSTRWTGWVMIDTPGSWDFITTSNDGVRLWVDGVQMIDNWNQHTVQTDTATSSLSTGWHPIRLEHFQQGGTAEITLSFSGPGQPQTIIPSTRLSATDPIGAPVVDAGLDQFLTLPTNSVTLDGSATDDGTIASYAWSQLDGPNNATLSGQNTEDLTAENLVQGTYIFELTATDDEGNTASDTASVFVSSQSGNAAISGELKKWHKVTLTFDGPQTSETSVTNPFTDFRLDVHFQHTSTGATYAVPGYYAADGDAANTSANSGNKWRVHFAPDAEGEWSYVASFRSGTDVAMDVNPLAGTSAGFFDGAGDTFTIGPTDKSGVDLRGRGRLQYVGERYLKFAEDGEYFLKQGADAPENLLAYEDFDGPFASDGQSDNFVKDWAPHVQDWQPSDPTWAGGKGKGLIGAINYLASEGLNAFSFLPMNIGGDDRNVFPYLDYNERMRMDVSRLDQWEVVFEHGDRMGMFMHFKTQETENELLLDGGNLGPERTLYYRELIARFSHHLALNWNLGEEINNATTAQKNAWADYFWDHDPYQHHIVIHNGANHYDLLGPGSNLTGFSLQTNNSAFINVHNQVKNYIERSVDAGKPWAVAVDEPGDAQAAIRPDSDPGNSHIDGRKNALWGGLMAGAWGHEYYFGYAYPNSDLTLEDFRSRDAWWDYPRHALEFFNDNEIPFWEMENDNDIFAGANDYGFVKPGEVYVGYLKNGGSTTLDLSGETGSFDVRWFDPRNGGALQSGAVLSVDGGGPVSVGLPPNSTSEDWTVLVQRAEATGPRVLFVRGGDRTGGFLEAGNDAARTEHLADINNFATNGGNHGWGELRLALEGAGFTVEQVEEGSETVSGPADGIHIDLETLNLASYDAIVFGSNNAVYDTAAIDAVESYIRTGGAALFISDANFGGDWADAPNSDQQFLDRFGLIMNQDAGTYTLSRSNGEFLVPDHPILAGVNSFDGEGVSPIVVGPSAPGVEVTILANAEGNTRVNDPPFGNNNQGSTRPSTANDAALLTASADAGRIVGHFDRNTFFNLNGAGTNINRLDNRQYALNLFSWLVADQGDFNADLQFDCQDIDALQAEIVAATDDSSFDINSDGQVDVLDRDLWLQLAADANGFTNPYLLGDATLDGTVDGQDFIAWNDNKFTTNSSWCAGDFNADGVVDGVDFVVWNSNKFSSSADIRRGQFQVAPNQFAALSSGTMPTFPARVANARDQVFESSERSGLAISPEVMSSAAQTEVSEVYRSAQPSRRGVEHEVDEREKPFERMPGGAMFELQ